MTETSAKKPEKSSRSQRFSRILRSVFVVFMLLSTLWAGGFLWFAASLARPKMPLSAKADGIVVLTGGADRIETALELLEKGAGKRLFISGVNVRASTEDLQERWPDHAALFTCCIDLDYQARNTLGNAIESRRWVLDHGFDAVLLVTASYHMPRALLVFQHAMPQTRIHAVSVVPESSKLNRWWQDRALARILIFEYMKYSFALLRFRLLGGILAGLSEI
jgi:uncharacterized SAM-binding protein YcdF (DUF218 family)